MRVIGVVSLWFSRDDDVNRVLTDPETFSSKVLGNVEIPERYRDVLPDDYFKHIVKALDVPHALQIDRA